MTRAHLLSSGFIFPCYAACALPCCCLRRTAAVLPLAAPLPLDATGRFRTRAHEALECLGHHRPSRPPLAPPCFALLDKRSLSAPPRRFHHAAQKSATEGTSSPPLTPPPPVVHAPSPEAASPAGIGPSHRRHSPFMVRTATTRHCLKWSRLHRIIPPPVLQDLPRATSNHRSAAATLGRLRTDRLLSLHAAPPLGEPRCPIMLPDALPLTTASSRRPPFHTSSTGGRCHAKLFRRLTSTPPPR
jgi:hypothetical protein